MQIPTHPMLPSLPIIGGTKGNGSPVIPKGYRGIQVMTMDGYKTIMVGEQTPVIKD